MNQQILLLHSFQLRLLGVLALCLLGSAQAARIEGVLRDSQNGRLLEGQVVEVYRFSDPFSPKKVASVITDFRGWYTQDGLEEGSYAVLARPAGYLVRAFGAGNGVTCIYPMSPWGCIGEVTPRLELGPEVTLRRDLDSEPAAQMRGTVFGEGADVLANAVISIRSRNAVFLPAVNPATGEFHLDHLLPGEYKITVCAQGWICRDSFQVESDAVGSDAPFKSFNVKAGVYYDLGQFNLRRGAVLQGRIVNPDPNAIIIRWPGPEVLRDDEPGIVQLLSFDGTFHLDSLRPGSFRLRSTNPDNQDWESRWFADAPCTPQYCDRANGTPVTLAQGESKSDIQLPLRSRRSISGQVRARGNGQPVPGILVGAARYFYWSFVQNGFWVMASSLTDADGRYTLAGLPADNFILTARRTDDLVPWVEQALPPPLACANCSHDPSQFSISLHSVDHVDGIDFALQVGGDVRVHIANAPNEPETPLFVIFNLISADPSQPARFRYFLNSGSVFRTTTVPAGKYYLVVDPNSVANPSLPTVLYPGVRCATTYESCPLAAGTPIEVKAGASTEIVEFVL